MEKIRNLALSVDGVVGCEDFRIIDFDGEQHITPTIKVNPTQEKTVNTINDARSKLNK